MQSAHAPQIVVHHDKQHFDLVTNLESFLMTGYYCEHCEKAYSNKEQHRREEVPAAAVADPTKSAK